ncbi:hypothetical protein ACFPC0_24575 [Streptomyces andamanensis]|uniref:HEAT repeat domain-containing protein n=1 Tax=Streptomyces andamanensis TaxID=1565035 RepID=A0ABV8TJZ0_9ACTN
MSGLRYVQRVGLALADGDMEAVLDLAVAAYETTHGFPGMVWDEVLRQLAEQPAGTRARLLAVLPARVAPARGGLRSSLLYLSLTLSRGLPGETLVAERREELGRAADHWEAPAEAVCFAEAELDAGRPLSPAVVAAIRRRPQDVPPGLNGLAGRMTEPVLNVGEQWAETAMADILGLRPVWRDLLAHAATARAVRPTATWERTGRALLDDIGPGAFRARALGWLALAGRPRTLTARQDYRRAPVNELLDPFNADALRGLTWLLALTGPDEETVAALGALTHTVLRHVPGHGPRNPKVANSAVYALERIGGPEARAELRRLAERITQGTTPRRIAAALDRLESQPQ